MKRRRQPSAGPYIDRPVAGRRAESLHRFGRLDIPEIALLSCLGIVIEPILRTQPQPAVKRHPLPVEKDQRPPSGKCLGSEHAMLPGLAVALDGEIGRVVVHRPYDPPVDPAEQVGRHRFSIQVTGYFRAERVPLAAIDRNGSFGTQPSHAVILGTGYIGTDIRLRIPPPAPDITCDIPVQMGLAASRVDPESHIDHPVPAGNTGPAQPAYRPAGRKHIPDPYPLECLPPADRAAR